nr:MAG TPA: hypothetical protein [Caudoviricetes sp.]
MYNICYDVQNNNLKCCLNKIVKFCSLGFVVKCNQLRIVYLMAPRC